jgi:amidase
VERQKMLRLRHKLGKNHERPGAPRKMSVIASERVDDSLGAFVPGTRCRKKPTATGSLDGLSFAVKDLIDVAGYPTGAGNPDWLRDQAPATASAPVVGALLDCGATLEGKTVTDELAFSLEGCNAHYGTPINPACRDRVPGGSSSGSAAAVAGGLADFALGTDTGGSVRVPASFVGVFGMRPSHGAVSLQGVVPFAPSYDTVGWLTRDAGTLSKVGAALLPKRPPAPISRLVIVRDAFELALPPVATALLDALRRWPIDGETTLFGGEPQLWLECYRVLQGFEIWQTLGPWIETAHPRLGASIARRFADAAAITAAQAAQFRPIRKNLAARVRASVRDDTALVLPSAPCAALRRDSDEAAIGAFYQKALTLTSVAGHAGAPQINLPLCYDERCPVGVSIVGAPQNDLALLDLAGRLANISTIGRHCHGL